jgi:CheY-like chemotaxis protein
MMIAHRFCKRSASTMGGAWLGQQIDALIEEVPHLAMQPRGAARVLWVDDRPANSEYERSLLRGDGIVFDNVVSIAEAIEQLRTSTYDLVITDLGRRWSSDRSQVAGRELLSHSVIADGGPPVVVYAGREAIRQDGELLALGAFGVSQNGSTCSRWFARPWVVPEAEAREPDKGVAFTDRWLSSRSRQPWRAMYASSRSSWTTSRCRMPRSYPTAWSGWHAGRP